MPLIALLGDINVDLLLAIRHYPPEGGDGVAERQHLQIGGSATNTAITLARLGMPVRLLGRVGDDTWATTVLDRLRDLGVDVGPVRRDPGEPTSINVITVSAGGERTMFAYRGANAHLVPEDVEPRFLGGADLLHLSGYAFLAAPQRDAAWRAVDLARERRVPIALDVPVETAHRAADQLTRLLPYLDTIVVGAPEAKALTGHDDPRVAAAALLRGGAGQVALKLGPAGCRIHTRGEIDGVRILDLPGFPVDVVDTTGAGDAFAAGILYGRAHGLDSHAAGVLANALGALATTRIGAGATLPGARETADLLRLHAGRHESSDHVAGTAVASMLAHLG